MLNGGIFAQALLVHCVRTFRNPTDIYYFWMLLCVKQNYQLNNLLIIYIVPGCKLIEDQSI